jgi:rifampicin phosphotransferase
MISRSSAPTDALMAQILAGVDAKQYRAVGRPSCVTFRLLWLVPRVFWNMRGFFRSALRALLFPESAYREYQRRVDDFETELRENLNFRLPLEDFQRTCEVRIAQEFNVLMSVLVVGLMSPALIVRGKSAEVKALLDDVNRGVTGNVVVEMGMALHRLANILDRSEFEDFPG